MAKLKIEAGKMYRTRCGCLVRIYATDARGTYPVHGAYFHNRRWQEAAWKTNGSFADCGEYSLDIVSAEPARKGAKRG